MNLNDKLINCFGDNLYSPTSSAQRSQKGALLRDHYQMAASKPTDLSQTPHHCYTGLRLSLRPQQSVCAVSLSTKDLSTQGLYASLDMYNMLVYQIRFNLRSKFERVRHSPTTDVHPHPELYLDEIQYKWPQNVQLMIRATQIAFVENQLYPNSVSFSLLIAGHPSLLQQTPVRASTFVSPCPRLARQVSGLEHETIGLFIRFAFTKPHNALNIC